MVNPILITFELTYKISSVLKFWDTTVRFVTIMNSIFASDSTFDAKASVVQRFSVGTLFDHFMLLQLSHHDYIWIHLRDINIQDFLIMSHSAFDSTTEMDDMLKSVIFEKASVDKIFNRKISA